MKKYILLLLLPLLLLVSTVDAQWNTPTPIRWVTALPSTCISTSKTQRFVATSSPYGLYQCVSSGIYLPVDSGSGNLRVVSDITNATTTLAGVTGLTSSPLIAGHTYTGRVVLFTNQTVTGDGVKFDLNGGTATVTDVRSQGKIFDTVLLLSTQTTALATVFSVGSSVGNGVFEIDLTFTCNAAGTFQPRFAKNTNTTGVLTVFRGSYMKLTDTP